MTTLATKSKHKKTLLTVSVFFFAALAFLYLNSFIQDHIIISLICFIFMLLFMAFTGILLFKHSKLPEVLAEYDKDTLYLHTGKQDIVIPWLTLESATRKGKKNKIGSVQYADIIFQTTENERYILPDVHNPDDVIIKIKTILNT